MTIKKFDTSKFQKAAQSQQATDNNEDSDVTMHLQYFVCWDCDEKHLNPYFAVQANSHFGRPLKCPRYPSHQHVEEVAVGEATIKWVKPQGAVFVD
jgi:hypothetical protein